MSRKLAGSPPARLTRSIVVIARPAPLTMQPIVPSSLMKVSVGLARLGDRPGPPRRGRAAPRARVAGERGVVERDLRVEADEPLDRRPVGAGLADDRERVDLDEVGVVGQHRPDEALAIATAALRCAAEPERERELAGLRSRAGRARDRRGAGRSPRGVVGDLLDLDAALGRAHQQDPPLGPVEDGREVELLDDVGGRRRRGPCGR